MNSQSGRAVGAPEEALAGLVVGVDASRNRSGGAKAHLVGMLNAADPRAHGISAVHVWSYTALLRDLPEPPWLTKHSPHELEMSLARQLWWQRRRFPAELRDAGCQILLSTDAGSACAYEPSVVMSRDMLSYEKGEAERFGFTLARLRLWALRHVQARSLQRADGAVFLTHYAASIIQAYTGRLRNVRIIPHGVAEAFRNETHDNEWNPGRARPVTCVYPSVVQPYKHQWNVVEGIAAIRKKGYNVSLVLAGGGEGTAQSRLTAAIDRCDPGREFVTDLGFVPHDRIPALLRKADIFVFASSCENMPNTVVEAMAGGMPIACSRRGPMPEVVQDAAVYFDPEDAASIASAVETIIADPHLRLRLGTRAEQLSRQYSWGRCAAETWEFVAATCRTPRGTALSRR